MEGESNDAPEGMSYHAIVLLAFCSASFASEAVVREFRLRYLRPTDELLLSVRDMLGPGGKADLIKSLNLIVVRDDEDGVRRVGGLLDRIDVMPAQVSIEARIVEVNTERSRELGVKWSALNTDVSGNVLGSYGAVMEGGSVTLPSSTDSGGAFTFGVITNKLSLDLKLSALESTDAAHVLSSPHIVVLRERARRDIKRHRTRAAHDQRHRDPQWPKRLGPAGAQSFSAMIELGVTPRLIEGGRIALDINTRREEFDYTRTIDGFPPKTTRSASTRLMVRDGDTVVIGGIYTKSNSDSEDRVPLLGRIPVLGWLFRHSARDETQTELMIFLTPMKVAESGSIISTRSPLLVGREGPVGPPAPVSGGLGAKHLEKGPVGPRRTQLCLQGRSGRYSRLTWALRPPSAYSCSWISRPPARPCLRRRYPGASGCATSRVLLPRPDAQ